MTTYSEHTVICRLCKHSQTVYLLGSCSSFGAPDLDARPAELARGAIMSMLQVCPECGYAAFDISSKVEKPKAVKKLLADFPKSESMSDDYYRAGEIARQVSNNHGEAFVYYLRAAWSADDEEDAQKAKEMRNLALKEKMFLLQSTESPSVEDFLQASDIARRAEQFDVAADLIASLDGKKMKPFIRKLVTYEKKLIVRKDTACHSVSEIEKKKQRIDKNPRDGKVVCVSEGEVANHVTVDSWGRLNVGYGGKANDTFVSNTGNVGVYPGGTINRTTLGSGAEVNVLYGASALDTKVENGGYLRINENGVANGIFVQSGGHLFVASGAQATGIIADKGANLRFEIDSESHIQGTLNESAFEMKGGHVSGYSIESGGLTIKEGCFVDKINITPYAHFYVESGGTATNIIADEKSAISFDLAPNTYLQGISNGRAFEIKNSFLESHAILNGELIRVFDGGTIDNIQMIGPEKEDYKDRTGARIGSLEIGPDGRVSNLDVSGGYVSLGGGVINNVSLCQGDVTNRNGTIDSIEIKSGGSLFVFSGGTVNHAVITGKTHVDSGGVIVSNCVLGDGTLVVAKGGTVSETTLSDQGKIIVSSGGTVLKLDVYGGDLQIENGAIVTRMDKHK